MRELLTSLSFDCIGNMSPQRIKAIRLQYRATQVEFAELLNVSYHTYKNWEIGHRFPSSPAAALLYIAEKHPEIFLNKPENLHTLLAFQKTISLDKKLDYKG